MILSQLRLWMEGGGSVLERRVESGREGGRGNNKRVWGAGCVLVG